MSTVVYVDDEPALCELIGRVLRRASIDVVTFTDPEEALAHINQDPPALVICDYRMRQMSGLTLMRRLEVEVPFVLISGDLGAADLDGLDVEVLAKPIRPEKLIAMVRTYL